MTQTNYLLEVKPTLQIHVKSNRVCWLYAMHPGYGTMAEPYAHPCPLTTTICQISLHELITCKLMDDEDIKFVVHVSV